MKLLGPAVEVLADGDKLSVIHLRRTSLLGFDWHNFASATPQLCCANPIVSVITEVSG